MARKASDAVTLQRIANSQGIVHIRIGDYPAALADLEEALASLARDPDPALEASLLLNTGGVYQRMGDHERAMEYCKRSLALGRALADERHVASTLTFLGDTAIALERLEIGRAHV